jgi:uncharacterized iron-regulated membrane protein
MVAMCLTGLTPLLLVATGLWVWLKKRQGRQFGEKRREQRRRSAGIATAKAAGSPLSRG